jgi:hypothetical protein
MNQCWARATLLAYAHGSLLALIGVLSDLPWLLVPVLAFLMLKDAATIVAHDRRCRTDQLRGRVRGAERDPGGLCPRAADRVRRGGHLVRRRLRARQSVCGVARPAGPVLEFIR